VKTVNSDEDASDDVRTVPPSSVLCVAVKDCFERTPTKFAGAVMETENSPQLEMKDEVAMEDTEDGVDETPVFIEPGDAVEVDVDDENMPMEDDDEEEEVQPKPAAPDQSQHQRKSHSGPVYSVLATSDAHNNLLIWSGGGDDQAFCHSAESTRLPHNHTDSVSSVAAYGNEAVAVGAYDGTIAIYDFNTRELIHTLEGPTDVEWVCFHPTSRDVILAGCAADGTVWLYHKQEVLQVFVGGTASVAGSFTPNGKAALTASGDGSLRLWAPKTGKCKHVFALGLAGLTCMAWEDESGLVIVGSEDGQAHVCHIVSKKEVASLRHYEIPQDASEEDELPLSVEAVGFSPAQKNWCATGGVDGVLKIWDMGNQAQCRQVCKFNEDEKAGITRLYWHPKQPYVFACYTNGAVRVWDARNGELLKTNFGGSEVINDMSIRFCDPEGRQVQVVTGSDDGVVRVFEMAFS